MKRFLDSTLALLLASVAVGLMLGSLGVGWIDALSGFVASAFTRLFRFLAMPTIALAIVTTLSSLGQQSHSGAIFQRALTYTLLTTLAAAVVGLALFLTIGVQAESVPVQAVAEGLETGGGSYASHLLEVVPDNVVRPFLDGNVLSVLLIAVAVGLALARGERSGTLQLLRRLAGELQELLFMLIRGVVRVLPVGIVAFSAQLAVQMQGGVVAGSLGRYLVIILCGNALQFCLILPLLLVARGLQPWRVLRAMLPAVLMALLTKSSAATLPVTMQSAEERLGARPEVARFVLPICTTINMNGCAAFILVTSLFAMQCAGLLPDASEPLLEKAGFYALWTCIAVFAAVGNAGVPMGCYFLTLSLVSGMGEEAVSVLGLILPLYTVIDMVETAENVWSDSCVCAIVDRETRQVPDQG